jgi:hypothetical protein
MDAALAKKLLLKPTAAFAVFGAPPEHDALLGGAPRPEGAELVLVYARSAAELEKRLPKAVKALGDETRLWLAYPKAKKLGTDLNRDILVRLLEEHGFEPCRMVSVDDTWSAMWFKRA